MSLSVHHIPKPKGLDPITLYVNDIELGRGSIVVQCYGCAWTCYWGSIGGGQTVRQFIVSCDEHYIANCLIRGRRDFISSRKAEGRELTYLARICAAFINHLKTTS